jgi:L-ascorbate metabolism protein UlaG (beta-lactamase superfamily)
MANLRITWLGHGGVLYRSPEEKWVWVDRWTGAPTYPDAYRTPEQVHVVAPTHGHFDHVGDDLADLVELASVEGAATVCSHEMSIWLAGRGIEAVGMNKGGTFEAAGIRFTMVHADHTGGATLTGSDAATTRELGCWGWIIDFEDGTTVYHSGDTDVFGDMALIGERFAPEYAVLPIGGHYTMGPADAARAIEMVNVSAVLPVHFGTFPVLAGTPAALADATGVEVIEVEPGETWEPGG